MQRGKKVCKVQRGMHLLTISQTLDFTHLLLFIYCIIQLNPYAINIKAISHGYDLSVLEMYFFFLSLYIIIFSTRVLNSFSSKVDINCSYPSLLQTGQLYFVLFNFCVINSQQHSSITFNYITSISLKLLYFR